MWHTKAIFNAYQPQTSLNGPERERNYMIIIANLSTERKTNRYVYCKSTQIQNLLRIVMMARRSVVHWTTMLTIIMMMQMNKKRMNTIWLCSSAVQWWWCWLCLECDENILLARISDLLLMVIMILTTTEIWNAHK